MNKWILVAALAVLGSVQYAESKKLLKLAAAAAIIRGGPIIPIPIRYPVHVPHHHKVVKVPVHHPVPVKVPVHHHSHSVEKIPVPIHSHSVHEKHVPVPIHGHHESIGLDHGYGGFDFGGHGHEEHGYGGEISDIGFGGHGW